MKIILPVLRAFETLCFILGCKKKFLLHQKYLYWTEMNQIVHQACLMTKSQPITIGFSIQITHW